MKAWTHNQSKEVLEAKHISLGKGNKSKNEQVGLHQAESFCTAKDTINRTKRHLRVWENIFINDISDKGLTSKIYEELTHLNK